MMAHAQKPDFVSRRNGRVHLNRRGRHFIRLLAAEVCAPTVVMLDTPCSEVVLRVLATHSIRQFPLHFPSRATSCAITFQLESKLQAWPALPLDRTRYPRNRRFEGTQRGSRLLGEQGSILPLPWFFSLIVQYVSLVAIRLNYRDSCICNEDSKSCASSEQNFAAYFHGVGDKS